MSSVRVGPEAPNASIGAGACARTPNVKTPETTCPSPDIACQRTVYAPLGSRGSVASSTRPWLLTLETATGPFAENSCTDPGSASMYWSNLKVIACGDDATRARKPGEVCSTVACAN